jgi:hypothetical protein
MEVNLIWKRQSRRRRRNARVQPAKLQDSSIFKKDLISSSTASGRLPGPSGRSAGRLQQLQQEFAFGTEPPALHLVWDYRIILYFDIIGVFIVAPILNILAVPHIITLDTFSTEFHSLLSNVQLIRYLHSINYSNLLCVA